MKIGKPGAHAPDYDFTSQKIILIDVDIYKPSVGNLF